MKQLKHNTESVVNIGYHIVWCPKYRRKVLQGKVETRLKEVLPEIAEEMECVIEKIEVMPDHLHVFLKGTPILPVHLIVKNLKSKSSRILRTEFPHLKSRLPNLWTRSYYCETVGRISDKDVRIYIDNQKNK